MSSQNEFHQTDASDKEKTRSKFNPDTTTTSDSAINLSDGLGSGSRKRKRDGNTMEDLLKDTFVVRPYPPKAPAKPRTLQPLILLPRSQLPLSSLDIFAPSNPNALPKSRLFETHVKILELEERMGNEPMVLIARLEDERTIYAVEREDRGLYVICKLGSWVNIQQLRAVAAVSRQEVPQAEKAFAKALAPQITTTPLLTATDSNNFSNKKRLAIEAIQSMVKRPATGTLADSQSNTPIEATEDSQAVTAPQESQLSLMEPVAPLTSTELFDNIRTQYFDALYLTNASLAYFVKGPLSRARAAFHLDYDSNLEMNDLIAFLESLILSTTVLDKKYRDGLPNCVSMMDIEDHSANEAANLKAKKTRVSKKMKPGKNGLYARENEMIRRWWEAHDDDAELGAPGVTREDIAKTRISHLRIRETQLQMILILEVLALRPLATVVEDDAVDLPGDIPKGGPDNKVASKTKKPDPHTMLIDVHIDRLCIWQSIASELGKDVGDSQASNSVLKHSDNIPRDFCVDVLTPFFSSRLPERCVAINKKLGGPVAIAPPKQKIARSASASGALSRPGAATKRPIPRKPRERLERVLTDERREQEKRSASAGPNRKISLMRSATMPAIPGLKREGSEAPSLSSIMSAESQPIFAARGGVLNSKRFAQREVDFSALAPDPNAKARKQAKIDSELKEAIAALKKPNREAAGKSFAETAAQRALPAPHPRKSKKPVRNPLFQGVEISATPRANRQMDMLGRSQAPGLSRAIEPLDFGPVASSSAPRVAQSSLPSQSRKPQKNPFLSSIQATPTRKTLSVPKPSEFGLSPLGGGFPPSSPIHVRRSSAQLFPIVPDSAVKATSKPPSFESLQETPVKKRTDSHLQHSHPCLLASGDNNNTLGDPFGLQETPIKKRSDGFLHFGQPPLFTTGSDKENLENGRRDSKSKSIVEIQSQEDSIYKSLGWDEGDMDELA